MTDTAHDLQSQSSAPWDAHAQKLSGLKVLVVEDNLIIAASVEHIARSFGACDVHVAQTVHAALELLAQGGVDLAVLDVKLRGETSEAVARACTDRNVPLILVTGYEAKDETLAAFPDAPVCVKPLSQDQFATVLHGMDRPRHDHDSR
ncbi:MAG: response regulator [Pseudomonadota bacterium]